jgi:GT2 family glycosyltransferase
VKVTAIVPTYNEERSIGECLTGLLQQRGVDDYEIVVVDGHSRDRTVDVVRSFPEFGTKIKLVENPRRFQVYAWNIGCRAAQGEYVVLISAHTVYGRHHFQRCLEAIERTGADAVGPVQMAHGEGSLGKAIAWCMSSPLGIGNARFRFTQEEEEVDSVFSMFFRRDMWEKLGGFDERVAFDEDAEFSYRMREAGAKIVVSPAIAVRYAVRGSLRGLSRQMFCYGYWRRFTQLLHPKDIPLRVLAPPALVAGLALSVLLLATPIRFLAPVLPLIYASYVLVGVAGAVPKLGLVSGANVCAVLPCMHLSYGLGFWRALMSPEQRMLFGHTASRSALL